MPKENLFLRCDFTEVELKAFSEDLAREIASLAAVEDQKKAANAAFADRIQAHKSNSSHLARNINMGYEMRLVECAVELDQPKNGRARLVRKDTGEIAREREMTPEERQMELIAKA